MNRLCTAAIASCLMGAVLAGGAFADDNSISFTQTATETGGDRIDITVTYVNPGKAPRQANSGVGFVRIMLPEASLTLDPGSPPDNGYSCIVNTDNVECSNDGQPSGAGTAFPTSVTVHLISASCYSPSNPSAARADIWAAANDPGTAPDMTFPLSPGRDCTADEDSPIVDAPAKGCVVPKLFRATLASAKRKLRKAGCAVGKVKLANSSKVKKGRVISQSLKPKKRLKRGAKVNLVVSAGP